MKHGLDALTEKERQTLRLIVRGHDAKSVARCLGLSVHTVNERLRDARRKVEVSSSREAARLLFEAEGSVVAPAPEIVGDTTIGDDAAAAAADQTTAPMAGARRPRLSPITIGVVLMSVTFVFVALAALQVAAPSTPPPPVAEAPNPAVVDAARQFLTMIDAADWQGSYRASGASFRRVNTEKLWAATSAQVRAPLGPMLSRTFVSPEYVLAPPHGFQIVKFRTSFANKSDAVETVTLDREDGVWRVVGIGLD